MAAALGSFQTDPELPEALRDIIVPWGEKGNGCE